jgi:peptide chain release factor 2
VALLELTDESAGEGSGDASLDAELVEMVDALGTRLGALELQSLFSGEYDELDAVCEVHAGAGGTDAQDWTEVLLRMYQRWAERRGFTVEVDEATEGQEAGLLSATFIVRGRFAYGLLAAERGVHRLVRMSPFDSQHRRQTSFASFDVVPFLDDVSDEVDIDEKDLRIDTYRSSGAGGQHVNKTDSAVRLTHLPTGLVVSCQNERSQHQNKARAMQILAAKLADRARAERRAELDKERGVRTENAWGNQIRSYVMAPYQLVKDLRTNEETGNVDAVLDGDLDAFMEAELRRQRSAVGGSEGAAGA